MCTFGDQSITLDVVSQDVTHCFGGGGGICVVLVFERVSLSGLELADSARLAGQRAPGVCLPSPPWQWDRIAHHHAQLFYVGSRDQIQVFFLPD